MILGGGNPSRHWHQWRPITHLLVDRTCSCGAIKRWNGKRWVVKKKKKKKKDAE